MIVNMRDWNRGKGRTTNLIKRIYEDLVEDIVKKVYVVIPYMKFKDEYNQNLYDMAGNDNIKLQNKIKQIEYLTFHDNKDEIFSVGRRCSYRNNSCYFMLDGNETGIYYDIDNPEMDVVLELLSQVLPSGLITIRELDPRNYGYILFDINSDIITYVLNYHYNFGSNRIGYSNFDNNFLYILKYLSHGFSRDGDLENYDLYITYKGEEFYVRDSYASTYICENDNYIDLEINSSDIRLRRYIPKIKFD